ncbi:MAG TPA: nuclear transport factor 2 family protein, partial [Baekduia sp.]|nr:nuclear transport factor 2 family protein [Baekduia sp.]
MPTDVIPVKLPLPPGSALSPPAPAGWSARRALAAAGAAGPQVFLAVSVLAGLLKPGYQPGRPAGGALVGPPQTFHPKVPGADHRHAASSTLEIPEGFLGVCVLAWRRRHPGLSGATFTGDPLGCAPMLSDRFRAAVEEGNVDQVPELFHEDAAFRSPVLFRPYEGRDQVLKVLRAAEQVLGIGGRFRYVHQLEDPHDR